MRHASCVVRKQNLWVFTHDARRTTHDDFVIVKIIVGLGNPGRTYATHRHNVGFWILDVLAKRHDIEIGKRAFGSFTGNGAIAGQAVLLVKPQTFMNVSGEAVAPIIRYYRMEPGELIVIHDDIDIELGKLKLAFGVGHGGHNGIRSIIDEIGSSDFFRVRVGVGRPPAGMDAADYVLCPFRDEETGAAKEMIERAADATELLIAKGLAEAQQRFH